MAVLFLPTNTDQIRPNLMVTTSISDSLKRLLSVSISLNSEHRGDLSSCDRGGECAALRHNLTRWLTVHTCTLPAPCPRFHLLRSGCSLRKSASASAFAGPGAGIPPPAVAGT